MPQGNCNNDKNCKIILNYFMASVSDIYHINFSTLFTISLPCSYSETNFISLEAKGLLFSKSLLLKSTGEIANLAA